MSKRETVAEFLARGGRIERCPPGWVESPPRLNALPLKGVRIERGCYWIQPEPPDGL